MLASYLVSDPLSVSYPHVSYGNFAHTHTTSLGAAVNVILPVIIATNDFYLPMLPTSDLERDCEAVHGITMWQLNGYIRDAGQRRVFQIYGVGWLPGNPPFGRSKMGGAHCAEVTSDRY